VSLGKEIPDVYRRVWYKTTKILPSKTDNTKEVYTQQVWLMEVRSIMGVVSSTHQAYFLSFMVAPR
jgi:hypothetical protein